MQVYVGVIITLLIPPLGLPIGLYGILNREIKWRESILCIAIGMASFAYSYHPTGTPDLVRYFAYMTSLKSKPISQAVISAMEHKEDYLYVFNGFCWLIAQTGDLHLAPGITVFIAYYIGLYVTCAYAEDNEIENERRIFYVFFIVLALQLVSITSNLRNITAFSIAGLALFRDVYQEKRNLITVLFYVLPLFIHTSAALMILIRFMILIPKRFRLFGFGIVLFIHPIVNTIHLYSERINDSSVFVSVFKSMIDTSYVYFNDTSSAWGLSVQNSIKQRISRYSYIGMALYVVIVFLVKSILYREEIEIPEKHLDEYDKKELRKRHYIKTESRKMTEDRKRLYKNRRRQTMENMGFIFALFTLACTTMLTPEYWRFVTIMILFGGPLFFRVCELDDSGWWYYINRGLILFVPFFLVVAMRNVLTAELKAFFLMPFFSSPFFVLGKDLVNILLSEL